MEAGSLFSSEIKRGCQQRYPTERTAMSQKYSPSFRVPLPFFIYGLLCLAGGSVWIILEPNLIIAYHYSPRIVSMTHLFVLGFLLSILFGSLYQLAPVVLETRLHNERLAQSHLACHCLGVTGMVIFFALWDLKQVGHFGSLLFFGMILFVYNILRTLQTIPKPNPVSFFIILSMFWLVLTMGFGLWVSLSKFWPTFFPVAWRGGAMHAHAHLGIIGIFLSLLLGVSFRLLPMFILSEIQSVPRVWLVFGMIHTGIAWLFWAIMLQQEVARFACAVLISGGLVVYGIEITAILQARKRRKLDPSLRTFLSGLLLLIPITIIGLTLAWPHSEETNSLRQLEGVYGLWGILGVISLSIIGMFNKIFPFLIWYYRYGPWLGRSPVPPLNELAPEILLRLLQPLYLCGILLLGWGGFHRDLTLTQGGALFLGAAIALFLIHNGLVFRHLWAPVTATSPQSALAT